MIKWTDVDLWTLEGAPIGEADRETRIRAMREFREHGSMGGVVFADPADFDGEGISRETGESLYDFGPSVAEIDFAGLD